MTFDDGKLETLLDILREAATSEIRPRFRKLEAGAVSEKKSSIDLVTDADLRSEALITLRLKEIWPDAHIVGEEAYELDRSTIEGLRTAPLAFVIDPVDGTFNFQAGLPVFGTNLAVVANGETIAAVIHEAILGDSLVAAKGAGARFVGSDGSTMPIAVAPVVPLSSMVGTISMNDIAREERRRIAGNLSKTKMAFGYNCSAYEYWMVATGKVHFIGHHSLMPWDHLAGVLIHAEAGGVTARFDGSPYLPGDTSGGILSAPDRDSWEMILAEIVRAQ